MERNKTISGKALEKRLKEQGYSKGILEETMIQIGEIRRLKDEKNAIVLAHYYVIDPIKEAIADYVGDSLELARAAKETDADVIVFDGVHFMAETAKILNPNKTVLIPDLNAGCSLAASITADDVKRLRQQYPDAAIVGYINTTAEVKAELDITVTSANAAKIVSQLPQDRIVYVPDKLMAANLARQITNKQIIPYTGTCQVHEEFTTDDIEAVKAQFKGVKILAHPECSTDVTSVADFIGSTSAMRNYVKENGTTNPYFLATECGLAGTLKSEMPDFQLVGACRACPYMKMNTIENTLMALKNNQYEVNVEENVVMGARRALERMLKMS